LWQPEWVFKVHRFLDPFWARQCYRIQQALALSNELGLQLFKIRLRPTSYNGDIDRRSFGRARGKHVGRNKPLPAKEEIAVGQANAPHFRVRTITLP
jgi:hypothetical protein